MALSNEEHQKTYNLIEAAKRDLERAVKDALIDNLVKEQMNEFEQKIVPTIRERVEKISFDGIAQMHDIMNLRDELSLYLHWNDEPKMKKFYTVDKITEVEVVDK